MFAKILKKKKKQKPDTACYQAKDGTLSNGTLHAEIMKGVSEDTGVAYARAQCESSMTKEELDAVFPV